MKKMSLGVTIVRLLSFCSALFLLLCFAHGGAWAAGDEDRQAMEKKVIELVNRARVKGVMCGSRYHKATRPVQWNGTLAKASKKHCHDMAANEQMGHTASDGSGPGDRIARLGYKWMTYGENVGEGYLTPEDVVNAWLRSQEHCENIMNPGFREGGAAQAKGARRTYWTLVLATPEFSSHIKQ